jgi:repressor LexA
MRDLTERQKEVISFISRYTDEHRYPPTIRDISRSFGISVKGAYDHIKAIERKGFIRYDGNKSRTIEVILKEEVEPQASTAAVPIIGNVAAGKPLLAEENLDGTVQIPLSLLGRGSHFALHVKGDSMRDAGIMDGDLAVFIQQQVADNGDIVVAMVDEAVTLKRFFKEKTRVKLQPENPAYSPIYSQDVRILGKLRCLLRKYQ